MAQNDPFWAIFGTPFWAILAGRRPKMAFFLILSLRGLKIGGPRYGPKVVILGHIWDPLF